MHLWAQVSKWWQSRRIEKSQMQEWQACVSFEVNFDFCGGGDEIADWRNGRMRNCRSQVHSLRCLSMKAEHHCHPTWCIIYFVHLTNPTTLGQSTTCRKANWKAMSFYFTRRGASFHISSWPSVLSTCFMEEVTDRYEDVDITLVLTVLCPYCQSEYDENV